MREDEQSNEYDSRCRIPPSVSNNHFFWETSDYRERLNGDWGRPVTLERQGGNKLVWALGVSYPKCGFHEEREVPLGYCPIVEEEEEEEPTIDFETKEPTWKEVSEVDNFTVERRGKHLLLCIDKQDDQIYGKEWLHRYIFAERRHCRFLGCVEHTSVLNQLIHEAKIGKKNLAVVWLDLANAYGAVPHKFIEKTMDHYHIPDHIRKIVQNYFGGLQLRFTVNKQHGRS
ncbi:unnamed protein product [Mytilus coruscus]|uniref:Reverse transcriptase domain-containing protein n=1 Tax=Mytilus coruscus TaxID=42192 RepID=A0A6J8BMW3_MYTCO|nr:unnamed protein product [Mytilus coruscus]